MKPPHTGLESPQFVLTFVEWCLCIFVSSSILLIQSFLEIVNISALRFSGEMLVFFGSFLLDKGSPGTRMRAAIIVIALILSAILIGILS